MQLLIAIAILLASLGPSVDPAFAVDPPKVPPKGIEGPDIRQNTMPMLRGFERPDGR